jgi:hypothetical protein
MVQRVLAIVLASALVAPGCASRTQSLMHVGFGAAPAQRQTSDATTIDAWRNFLTRLKPGTRLKITLKSGTTMRVTLMQVTDTAAVVNPRTRVPEPVQTVAFTDLAAVDLESDSPSVAKSVGIGVASGVGAFFTILLIAFASWD